MRPPIFSRGYRIIWGGSEGESHHKVTMNDFEMFKQSEKYGFTESISTVGCVSSALQLKKQMAGLATFQSEVDRIGLGFLGDVSQQGATVQSALAEHKKRSVALASVVAKAEADAVALEKYRRGVMLRLQDSAAMLQKAMSVTAPTIPSHLGLEDTLTTMSHLRGLQQVGVHINTLQPYGRALTAAMRSTLGDWRSVRELPTRVFSDPAARLAFYSDLGFNRGLLNSPRKDSPNVLRSVDLPVPTVPDADEKYDGAGYRVPEIAYGGAEEERAVQVFRAVRRLEVWLRQVVDELMTEAYGPSWLDEQMDKETRTAWVARREAGAETGRPSQPLIAYAFFGELLKIIERRDNWRNVFELVFRRKQSVQETFWRLTPVRNCACHARLITAEDVLLLRVETTRLVRAVGMHG